MDTCMTLKGENVKVHLKIGVTQISWTRYVHGLWKTDVLLSKVILTSKTKEAEDKSELTVVFATVLRPTAEKILVRKDSVTFIGLHQNCMDLHTRIADLIRLQESHRPKHLLVFINPRSGRHHGVQIYNDIVLPLLEECGVRSQSIVTQSATHANEILAEYDLSNIDGVVSIGGDGSLKNVIKGLIMKKDSDIDGHKSSPGFKQDVPVMPLPAGTGCLMSLYSGGAMDVETCTLALILGKTSRWDAVEIRSNGKHVGFSIIIVGNGIFTKAYIKLERLRILGKLRYLLLMPLTWYEHEDYELQIDFKPAKPAKDDKHSFRLVQEVEKVVKDGEKFIFSNGPQDGWKTLFCRASQIFIEPIAMRNLMIDVSRQYYHAPDFSTGKLLLSIMKSASVWDQLWAYVVAVRKGLEHVPVKYMESIEITDVKIRYTKAWSDCNLRLAATLDGEVERLDWPEYEATVHKELIKMFCLDPTLVHGTISGDLHCMES